MTTHRRSVRVVTDQFDTTEPHDETTENGSRPRSRRVVFENPVYVA
ncbi:hypothetical protein [Halomontanus rarus]